MIPVDLNRLREAREDVSIDEATYTEDEIVLLSVADAVLGAPTVNWCEAHGTEADQWCWRGQVTKEQCRALSRPRWSR